ncbi:MAG TPA: AAA family ATPase [Streptosporangiaceae bacterium]|nr:AAA family ATPase [Streptosporangiaceae bacterium]
MLGQRQKAALAELAQWWEGIRHGGVGSHVVLLTGPSGWGKSTVLGQLAAQLSEAGSPASVVASVSAGSLPGEPVAQGAAIRSRLLGAGVRRQAAGLLCRSRLGGATRLGRFAGRGGAGGLGAGSLLASGLAGTISLLWAGLAAAAGGVPEEGPASENGAAARAARVVAAISVTAPVAVIIDDADVLDPGLAITMIENLIDHHDGRVLVVAAVGIGSDLAAALTSRARHGRTAGRVHRADTDPRMGFTSRAELASELSPHLGAAGARHLARQTQTFAEVFAAARSLRLPGAIEGTPGIQP